MANQSNYITVREFYEALQKTEKRFMTALQKTEDTLTESISKVADKQDTTQDSVANIQGKIMMTPFLISTGVGAFGIIITFVLSRIH